MDIRVIETAFKPDPDALLSRLGLDAESDEAEDFLRLLSELAPVARPKAVIGEAKVSLTEFADRIMIGGVEFVSRLLVKNLAAEEVAWPYIATCGRELYDRVMAIPDPFERYWGDEIMLAALTQIRSVLKDFLAAEFFPGATAWMSPGSLVEWPIRQQVPLFRLLGEGASAIGVELTDSQLMIPNKSVSGIRFHNEHGYVDCCLCPRINCPNRKADLVADVEYNDAKPSCLHGS